MGIDVCSLFPRQILKCCTDTFKGGIWDKFNLFKTRDCGCFIAFSLIESGIRRGPVEEELLLEDLHAGSISMCC